MSSGEVKSNKKIVFLAFFLCVLNGILTQCICGHLDFVSLPGSILSLGLACYALRKQERSINLSTIFTLFVTTYTAMTFFQNIHNILWSGHNPLL